MTENRQKAKQKENKYFLRFLQKPIATDMLLTYKTVKTEKYPSNKDLFVWMRKITGSTQGKN